MKDYTALLDDVRTKLLKSIVHLEFSYNKIQNLTHNVLEMDDEMMETWESFSARFSRTSDIFLSRFVRTVVLFGDPGFEGSLRDYTNKAEKLGLIEDASVWMEMRELRNVTVHDYNETKLSNIYRRIRELAPLLIALKEIVNKDWVNES